MAPKTSVPSVHGKENRVIEPKPKISAKDLKIRGLSERNARLAGEKSVGEKPVRTPQVGPKPGPVTPRSARGRPDPLEAEVKAATAEAETLEAELSTLMAECEDLEVQVAAAEAQEAEAEQQLTSQSAAMLSEYASAHERFKSLEEQLRAAREGLATRRKENLELSRKNIELDRASRSCHTQIQEAQAELEKCSRSQGAIDEEIQQQLRLCEDLRLAAEGQSQRLTSDLRRFVAMKGKLQDLLETIGSDRQKEVLQLIAEADDLALRSQKSLDACMEVVEKGIVPAEVPAEPSAP